MCVSQRQVAKNLSFAVKTQDMTTNSCNHMHCVFRLIAYAAWDDPVCT